MGIVFGIVYVSATQLLGRAWVYSDTRQDAYMSKCQSAGYSYGECYNRIIGHDKDAFSGS